MPRVITESEAANTGQRQRITYPGDCDNNRCCTRARAENLNCEVTDPSGAASNQLVCTVYIAYNYSFSVIGANPSNKSAGIASYRTPRGTSSYVAWKNVSVYSSSLGNVTISWSGGTGTVKWTNSGSGQIVLIQNYSGKSLTISV